MNAFLNRGLSAPCLFLCTAVLLSLSVQPAGSAPAVFLNEIHYHPVEIAAFNADGSPILDLSEDVHEFLEIFNAGPTNVPLAGWRLTGDIDFSFPTNAILGGGRYLVVAKNPARLASIPQYGLNVTNIAGPYNGQLSNGGGTVRLRDAADNTIDSVSFSAEFPWAISADALGADDEWTRLNSTNFQYRGRSLERSSLTWPANDPANWLASPVGGNPSPGRANAVLRSVPRPVVVAFAAYQDSTGSAIIRANQPVRIDCTFSATNPLSSVAVEYFVDDINSTTEPRTTVDMTGVGAPAEGRFTVVLPGRVDRSLVRYRFRANRGGGIETVSPRADDPYAWHAYFVTPVRASTNRIYDCFISAASLNTLATNLNPPSPGPVDIAVLRRITQPNPPGIPSVTWNATEPAVFVFNGVVYDARARHHSSQYRRDPFNNSWKWQFPRYHRFEGREGFFISDNDDITVVCHALYRLAGFPSSGTKWIEFYLNNAAGTRRMDQDEMDDRLSERFAKEQALANPGTTPEPVGEFYKAQGNFLFSDPTGPFGYGGYRLLPALPPYWSERARYEWTFGLQMHGWKGYNPFIDFVKGMWAARGDTHTAVNPNLPNLRAYLLTNCDVDAVLTVMAIRTWSGGWDDFNHNHFLWRRANGKWAFLAWDFDAELGGFGNQATAGLYLGEFGAPLIYTQFGIPPIWVDANWVKDSFYKAFRQEYKQKLFLLNNTLLNPTNIVALGFGSFSNYAAARFASINSQLGLGPFQRPRQPMNREPAPSQGVLPPRSLAASPYSHTTDPAPAHASTTWWMRATNGTYAAPVFKLTSSSNLTSIPIPFDKMTFGETYFWKCLYTDTNGHPSFESAETYFLYGADPPTVPLITIDADTLWRYAPFGTNPPANWTAVDFDDSSWLEGAPLFGNDAGPLPEPIRTTITLGTRVSTYFRKTFVYSGDPANTFLRLRHVVDDGVAVYLNGAEIHRLGLPAGTLQNSTLANRTVTDAVYEGPFLVIPTNLVVGTNVLAARVHRVSTISPDVVFGLALEVSVPPMPGSIVLNEILARNRSAITNGTRSPDYIELYNNTDQPQNLNGFSLSDNPEKPGKFIFPPDTLIEPLSHLVVWCDDDTNAPGLHTGFGLDDDGQTVALFTVLTNGFVLSDSVTFGLQAAEFAIGRAMDGAGEWELNAPTPGQPNSPLATASPVTLRINEWMATDANGPDWFEILNPETQPVALGGLYLSDSYSSPTNTRIAALSFIGPGEFRQFIADDDETKNARHVNFRLDGNGDSIVLSDANLAPIDAVTFGPQVSGVSEGWLPEGTANRVSFPNTASPGDANYLLVPDLVINEVLSHSDPPLEDAVEFHNSSDALIDISGWWLSDEKSALQKYQIPPNTSVPPGGYLVLYENQFNPSPGALASFAFNSAHGDAVHLSAVDAIGNLTGYRATASFDAAESGVSIGRFETSQGTVFVALNQRTFGADNAGTVEEFRGGAGAMNATAKVGPVVVSEIQFHPPDFPGGTDNTRDEFIELRNITADRVALFDPAAYTNRWRLRDAVSFAFPTGVTLEPGEAILVVSFDPRLDTNALAGFLDTYGDITNRLFGPYSGKLDNSRDSVELVKPDSPVSEPGLDFGFVPSILVDKVTYTDRFPWPGTADGTGFSIMRLVPRAYGDDPTNWFAWAPSPGRENGYNQLPLVSLLAPTQGATFDRPTGILLSADAMDDDGAVSYVEFFNGTNKIGRVTTAPYQHLWTNLSFGPHVITARARDNGGAAGVSAPISIQIFSQPPAVVVSGPANGAILVSTSAVALAASVTDPDTAVAKVEFYVDGAKVAEDISAPYAGTWNPIPGSHAFTAVATDSSGASGTSAVVSAFVQTSAILETVAIASNSTWKYIDNGANQGSSWIGPAFGEIGWKTGQGQFGYGDLDETTVLLRTNASGTTNITFYFRQKFVLASGSSVANVRLNVLRDDGAVAYLNTAEVFRNNMPAGAISFQTFALNAINAPEESVYYPTNVNPLRLIPGTNVLAVEVHQQSLASSDVSFDAELRIGLATLGPAITSQPQGTTNLIGGTVTLSVAVAGTAPFTYQWRRDGVPLVNSTNSSLAFNAAQPSDAGVYTVTVSNAVTGVTSLPATLAVLDPLADADGDGMSNEAEIIAGTDPFDAASQLRIDSIAFGEAAVLAFRAEASLPYTVQYATDPAGEWLNLTTLAAQATARDETVVDRSTGPRKFFRLATPTIPVSTLRIDTLSRTRGVTLNFRAAANRSYTVQFADAPTAGPWMKLADVPARAIRHTATVSDPNPGPSRFYRVVTPMQP